MVLPPPTSAPEQGNEESLSLSRHGCDDDNVQLVVVVDGGNIGSGGNDDEYERRSCK